MKLDHPIFLELFNLISEYMLPNAFFFKILCLPDIDNNNIEKPLQVHSSIAFQDVIANEDELAQGLVQIKNIIKKIGYIRSKTSENVAKSEKDILLALTEMAYIRPLMEISRPQFSSKKHRSS